MWVVGLIMLWGMLLGWALTVSVTQFVNPRPGKRRRI